MWDFLKKDLLILVRDRAELILLLLMPFILISILGFALRGLMTGDTEVLRMQVAIVQQDQEAEGIAQFQNDLEKQNFSNQMATQMDKAASEVLPYQLLGEVLEDDSVRAMIEVIEMNKREAERALKEETIEAILILPENFTYHTLKKMFLNIGEGSQLELLVQQEGELQAGIFQNIMESFTRSVNFEYAIATASGGQDLETGVRTENLGEVETISTRDPVTSFQYYTLAIAVMFVMYVASTIGIRAYMEKYQYVFSRIILAGRSPFAYLSGKLLSTIAIVIIQLFILFTLSAFIFQSFDGESLSFWGGVLLISIVLAICVGSLATLLTSLSVRYDSNNINVVFSGGVVTLFALVGGSFVPASQFSSFSSGIGEWTPNGAALSAYTKWLQGAELINLLPELSRIIAIAVILFLISFVIFPKRRSAK
ncbi:MULTISPECIES: ABC transporter permease [Paraliobacillus]|uniref:ABC transporter permease n=1 Tax=Paraliobacillus TaxID=200903 RepID=UPI000DD3198E|nr:MULTISPECIES: ABC transporter permease [Paraliobacillus]